MHAFVPPRIRQLERLLPSVHQPSDLGRAFSEATTSIPTSSEPEIDFDVDAVDGMRHEIVSAAGEISDDEKTVTRER